MSRASSHATAGYCAFAESAMAVADPPSRGTFFSLPSAMKAIHSPSGEKTGAPCRVDPVARLGEELDARPAAIHEHDRAGVRRDRQPAPDAFNANLLVVPEHDALAAHHDRHWLFLFHPSRRQRRR